jgi:hypothetical protein
MNTAPISGTTQRLNAIIVAAASPSKPAEITHFNTTFNQANSAQYDCGTSLAKLEEFNFEGGVISASANLVPAALKIIGGAIWL